MKSLNIKDINLSNLKYNLDVVIIILILIFILILGIFGIHGSSVGSYHQILYEGTKPDENLILGVPRGIRSDEWLVNTPYTVAQSANNFKRYNDNIGDGLDMAIFYDAPSLHWTTFFKPLNNLFFILPLENAFALKWWLRGFLLLVSVYAFLSVLTKNRKVSILGALIVLFTPFVNWWYSTTVLELITFSCLILFFLYKQLHEISTKKRILYYLLMTYFAFCFILILYPPFQIGLVWGIVLLFLAFIIEKYGIKDYKSLIKEMIILIPSITIVFLLIIAFYIDLKEPINLMISTSYPGDRVVEGGGYNIYKFFNYFYNYSLVRNSNLVPEIFGNQSEAANFFMGFIVVIPFIVFNNIKSYFYKKKFDTVEIFLSILIFVTLIWFFIGLPEFLETITLFDKVPMPRMVLSIGFWGYILMFYYISKKLPKISFDYRLSAIIVSVCTALLIYYMGIQIINMYQNYPLNIAINLIISIITGITLYLALIKNILFLFVVLLFSILFSVAINPLYRGLSIINNDRLSELIQNIKVSESASDYNWITYGDIYWENILISNGVRSLSSTHFYPQFEMWEIIDPSNESFDIYNRYAHIKFDSEQEQKILLAGLDFISVGIGPCSNEIFKLNVKYILSDKSLKGICLEERGKVDYPSRTFYIYKLNY